MTHFVQIQSSTKDLSRKAVRSALGAFCITVAAMGGIQLSAQALGSHNSNAPVDYAADRIELQDRQNRVLLSGNVDIRQAGLQVRAARTLVSFSDSGELSIQRITATGGVRVTRGKEAATGDVAVYDFNRRIITMAGNVRLQRGSDTLHGGRLVIDLQSGISSVDGQSTGGSSSGGSDGRVSGSFSVPQSGADDSGQ